MTFVRTRKAYTVRRTSTPSGTVHCAPSKHSNIKKQNILPHSEWHKTQTTVLIAHNAKMLQLILSSKMNAVPLKLGYRQISQDF